MQTVKVRVRPGNSYGSAVSGTILEVPRSELQICGHALELFDESAVVASSEIAQRPTADPAFEALRNQIREQREQAAEAEIARQAATRIKLESQVRAAKKERK